MKNLLNPKWLLVVNTLPIVLLFILQVGDFQVIKSLLEEDGVACWKLFGSILAGLAVINALYAGFLIIKKKTVSVWYVVFGLVAYIAFLYGYYYNINYIFPSSVPQWMLSGNVEIYACTFLMPMMAYCLFVLVVRLTSSPAQHKAWLNFLLTISVPIGVYLFGVVILPLFNSYSRSLDQVLLILFIIATLAFLFFLVRSVYILTSKKASFWKKYQLFWKIPVTILFPILGLFLNNGWFTENFFGSGGVFGDFSSFWFPLLALVTGGLLCLPNPKDKLYRLLLYLARCVTFTYSIYFFLVFLPYLPLSILAILLVGVGFLMLSPLLLFVVHVNDLYKDFVYLARFYSRKLLTLLACAAFLIIPVIMTVNFMHDREVLNEAMEYVYKADYSKSYSLDRKSIGRTLHAISGQKQRGSILFFDYTPYISTYYNWLVLDNMTLSDKKINTLQYIFEGKELRFSNKEEELRSSHGVELTDWQVESEYDESQQAWKSWVHLEITADDSGWGSSEYATAISLPDGCWISDYYLYVGDRKEMGILSEKKSAMWVYSQIKDENKDPGILHYLSGNRIAFKVFPFAQNEVRKTGIEFIHKEPAVIVLDSIPMLLGNLDREWTAASTQNEPSIQYISAKEKENLREVTRKSYFHFLVDVSAHEKDLEKEWVQHIEKLKNENPHLSKDAKVSLVDTYVRTFSIEEDWKSAYEKSSLDGGFYADRGIKTALYQAWQEDAYPVIVVLTNRVESTLFDTNYADFKYVYPESDYFYTLWKDGRLRTHSLLYNSEYSWLAEVTDFSPVDVLEYKHSDGSSSYLRNDGKSEVILKKDKEMIAESDIRSKDWTTALLLQGEWLSQQMRPNYPEKDWLNLVQQSFDSGILTPVTSYMVVENEAQKAALLRKQKEVLSSDRAFDIGGTESSQRMSEPSMMILLVLMGIVMTFYYRRRRSMIR